MALTDEEIIVLLKLVGQRETMLGLQGVADAELEVAGAADEAGLAMERAGKRSFLMQQGLFTLRRLTYASTLALVASGAMAVKWGWDFNSAMQQARVALAPLQMGTFNVNQELDRLFSFTKYTPFQFKDVTIAFRTMYGVMHQLGISATQVNFYLKAITDSLAFVGKTSPGQLNRVSVALQHLALIGHVTGQVLMQLNRDGLPATLALKKELGLTGDQIHNIGKLAIPAGVALNAIARYIETTPGYANAAHRLAIGSLHGLFTTFKDNLSQLMGAVEIGFFKRMQGNLVHMNQWFDNVSKQIKASGGGINNVIRIIDPALLRVWHLFAMDLSLAWQSFSGMVGSIVHSRAIWAYLYAGLELLHGVLWFLRPLFQHMALFLDVLVPLWVTWKVVTTAAALATWLDVTAKIADTEATKAMTFAQFLATIAMGRYQLMAKLSAVASYIYIAALYLLSAAEYQVAEGAIISRAATWLWTAAVYAAYAAQAIFATELAILKDSTIATAIATKAAAAADWIWIAALYAASFATGVLSAALETEAIAAALAWTATFLPIAIVLAGILAIAAALYLVIRYWNELKHAWNAIFGATGNGSNSVQRQVRSIPRGRAGIAPPGALVPVMHHGQWQHLAAGGYVSGSGWSWVGEQGPELMHMQRGATVVPLNKIEGGDLASRLIQVLVKPAPVLLNGRKVGDVIFDEVMVAMGHA